MSEKKAKVQEPVQEPVQTGLDPELQARIDAEFAEYERYLRTPQDVAHYRRSRRMYWANINAELAKETVIPEGLETNGRTDNDDANGGN